MLFIFITSGLVKCWGDHLCLPAGAQVTLAGKPLAPQGPAGQGLPATTGLSAVPWAEPYVALGRTQASWLCSFLTMWLWAPLLCASVPVGYHGGEPPHRAVCKPGAVRATQWYQHHPARGPSRFLLGRTVLGSRWLGPCPTPEDSKAGETGRSSGARGKPHTPVRAGVGRAAAQWAERPLALGRVPSRGLTQGEQEADTPRLCPVA